MPAVDDHTEAKIEQWTQAEDVPSLDTGRTDELLLLRGLTCPQSLAPSSVVHLFDPSPNEMLLGTLGDARLRPLEPIRIKISVEGSEFVAEAADFNEFGFGSSPPEAIRDLQRALVELYLTLEQEQNHLGPDLAKLWASLTVKLARKK